MNQFRVPHHLNLSRKHPKDCKHSKNEYQVQLPLSSFVVQFDRPQCQNKWNEIQETYCRLAKAPKTKEVRHNQGSERIPPRFPPVREKAINIQPEGERDFWGRTFLTYVYWLLLGCCCSVFMWICSWFNENLMIPATARVWKRERASRRNHDHNNIFGRFVEPLVPLDISICCCWMAFLTFCESFGTTRYAMARALPEGILLLLRPVALGLPCANEVVSKKGC